MSDTKEQKKNRIIIAMLVCLIIVLAIVIGLIIYLNSPGQRVKRLISMGDKYLDELEYEDALLEYQIAAAIDPKSVDAYVGVANAYIGLDAYDLADEILEKGVKHVGEDNELLKLQDKVHEEIARIEEIAKLKEMAEKEEEIQETDRSTGEEKAEVFEDVEEDEELLEEDTDEEWKEVYRDFIENKGYLKNAETYDTGSGQYNNELIAFALYDMDLDGIPELLINNGEESYADNSNYVYSYKDGAIIYIGILPGASSDFRYGENSDFPGLFIDGMHTGSSWTEYDYKNGYSIESEMVSESEDADLYYGYGSPDESVEVERTSNDKLYRENDKAVYNLKFITESEYPSLGWDAFLNKYAK